MTWTNTDNPPPGNQPGDDGEEGLSDTVLVQCVTYGTSTTAWYDYRIHKWSTDSPVDGLREDEINDSEFETVWMPIPRYLKEETQ